MSDSRPLFAKSSQTSWTSLPALQLATESFRLLNILVCFRLYKRSQKHYVGYS